MKEEFAERVNNKCDGNEDWYSLKRMLLDVASEVCDYTKSKPMYFEIWCWNKDIHVAACSKRELFRIMKGGRNEENRKKYYEVKKDAKRAAYMAMDQKS